MKDIKIWQHTSFNHVVLRSNKTQQKNEQKAISSPSTRKATSESLSTSEA